MMRKIIILVWVLIFPVIGNTQGWFSEENLSQLSQEELQIYLDKTSKLEKNAKILIFIGAASGVSVGAGYLSNSWPLLIVGIGTTFIGVPTLIIGIPSLIIAKIRAKRIQSFMNNAIPDSVNNAQSNLHSDIRSISNQKPLLN